MVSWGLHAIDQKQQVDELSWLLKLHTLNLLYSVQTTHFCLVLGFPHLLGRCQLLWKCKNANQIKLHGMVHCHDYRASFTRSWLENLSTSCTLKTFCSGNVLCSTKIKFWSPVDLHLKTRLDSPASALTRSLGLKCKDCRVCVRPGAHMRVEEGHCESQQCFGAK